MTFFTEGSYIKPMFLFVTVIMVILFGLIVTIRTLQFRNRWNFAAESGISDCHSRFDMNWVSSSMYNITSTSGGFALFSLAVLFQSLTINIPTFFAFLIFRIAIFASECFPIFAVFVIIKFIDWLNCFTLRTLFHNSLHNKISLALATNLLSSKKVVPGNICESYYSSFPFYLTG